MQDVGRVIYREMLGCRVPESRVVNLPWTAGGTGQHRNCGENSPDNMPHG